MTNSAALLLLKNYRKGRCTPAEEKLVHGWYNQLAETGDFGWVEGERDLYAAVIQANLLKSINGEITIDNIGDDDHKPKRRILWFRWVAAASVIFILGAGGYFFLQNKKAVPVEQSAGLPSDIPAPADSRAVITLADGQKIYLDNAGTGTLAKQEGSNVLKNGEGAVVYQPVTGNQKSVITYNTLSNPRGSKVVNLTLADGSKVWLNAASSVTYPTAFTGNTREVVITGEAYFEVAKKASPFFVKANNITTEVLGTHFNVNSYSDESSTRVTLLEGKVKVRSSGNQLSVVLKPGQQAVAASNIPLTTTSPDLEQVMAWKNGRFQFGDGTDIKQVMKELERWYDITVTYKGDVKGKIGGRITRTVNISQVLQMLELTGGLKFSVQGRTVIVTPAP